jgi:hypothetical protein
MAAVCLFATGLKKARAEGKKIWPLGKKIFFAKKKR